MILHCNMATKNFLVTMNQAYHGAVNFFSVKYFLGLLEKVFYEAFEP